MNYFFDLQKKAFYVQSVNKNIPSVAVEISEQEYAKLLEAISSGCTIEFIDGCFIVSELDNTSLLIQGEERAWRNSELVRSDIELNKVQDSDIKSEGSVADWRAYRKMLRAWPEHINFPIKEFRPKAPDADE